MADPYIVTLSILKTITIGFGLVFLYLALRAYLRHRTRSMLVLFIAVGLMTAAAVAEGAALQILGLSLDQSHVIEAVFTLAAFVVLVVSIFSHRMRGTEPVE